MHKLHHRTHRHVHDVALGILALNIILIFFQLAFHTSAADVVRGIAQDVGGAVGMTAQIEPNSYNGLAQQLAIKEADLNTRERLMDERAALLNAAQNERQAVEQVNVVYLIIGGVFFLTLIAINYYLDYRRKQQLEAELRAAGLRQGSNEHAVS